MSNRDDRIRRDQIRLARLGDVPPPVPRARRRAARRARDRAGGPRRVRWQRQQQWRKRRVGRRRQQVRRDLELDRATWTRRSRRRTSRRTPGIDAHLRRGHQLNNEYFAKIRPNLQQGPEHRPRRLRAHRLDGEPADQPGEVGRAVRRGRSSRTRRTCAPALKSPAFDPTRKFSAPWASGVTGIAYNIGITGKEIKTIDEFLAVEGTTTVLDEMRDTVGLFMRSLDIDTDEPDLRRRPSPRSTSSTGRVQRRQDRRHQRQRVRERPRQREPRGRVRVVGRRRADHARTTRTCASWSRTPAGCSGPTTS